MRTVQTFILRLLVDPGQPEVLRGALQPVPEGEPRPFVGERELLALLQPAASRVPHTPPGAGQPGDER